MFRLPCLVDSDACPRRVCRRALIRLGGGGGERGVTGGSRKECEGKECAVCEVALGLGVGVGKVGYGFGGVGGGGGVRVSLRRSVESADSPRPRPRPPVSGASRRRVCRLLANSRLARRRLARRRWRRGRRPSAHASVMDTDHAPRCVPSLCVRASKNRHASPRSTLQFLVVLPPHAMRRYQRLPVLAAAAADQWRTPASRHWVRSGRRCWP